MVFFDDDRGGGQEGDGIKQMKEKLHIGVPFLMGLAILAAFLYNYYAPEGIPLFGQWDTEKGTVKAVPATSEKEGSIEISDSEWVEQVIQSKNRLIIDTRPKAVFNQGHLPGAVSFPLVDFEDNFQRMMTQMTHETPLLIYCSGADCTDSHAFADILMNMQFTDVKIYTKGFRGWKKEGRTVHVAEN